MKDNPTLVIFTKTNWDEPPRIRHQITQMLHLRGYKIIFFERNSFKKINCTTRIENGIKFYSHWEPIHHQLRPFKFLIWINNYITKQIITRILKHQHFDAILNFCYDYSFLKELFPDKRIVTLINDDFELQAKSWMKKSIKSQLDKTLAYSDNVLTVSYPLLDRLRKVNVTSKLFLPWASIKYKNPKPNQKRDVILYYGYINHRVDFDVLLYIANKGIKILLAGPIESKVNREKLDKLIELDNVNYMPPSSLSELDLDNVCCSILSYDRKIKSVNASTMSNRGFNLLSFGIPLLYVDLPFLLKAPKEVLISCSTEKDYLRGAQYYINNFDLCQEKIKLFLTNHYEENRFDVLKSALFG